MDTQVSIIGAGPVGLLAAANLTKSGIKVRIFENKKEIVQLSKALAVHSGTLELLQEVNPELLKRFLQNGKKIRGMNFAGKHYVSLEVIPSEFNFILALEQQQTEAILEKYLNEIGASVERGCTFTDFKDRGEFVVAEIVKENGEKFEVKSDYLLDCSGAHSIIRKNILKIPFEGEKYFGKLVMADIKVDSEIDNHSGYTTNNEKGIAALLPLNHDGHFRVILIPKTDIEIPEQITISFFKTLSKSIVPEIELSDENNWLTSFEISKRMASKLNVGRVFLAGDAAHVHSPVGGQGMNLGMQDAFNISAKLTKVLKEKRDPAILNDYEKERLPVIADVLKMTNAAMKSGVEKSALSAFLMKLLRKIIAPIFFNFSFVQKKLVTKMSQITSARKEIAIMRK